MNIKLKYKAWIGEKHADIAHKLIECDIETFAIEFAEHLVKNCSISNVCVRHCSDFAPPFRVGRKKKRAILDANGKEVVIFKNSDGQAQLYCDYLNGH